MSKIIATLLVAFCLLIAGNSEKENAVSAPMLVTIASAVVQPCAPVLVTADSATLDKHSLKAKKDQTKKKFVGAHTKHHKHKAPHHHSSHAPHHHRHAPQKISPSHAPLFLTVTPTCA